MKAKSIPLSCFALFLLIGCSSAFSSPDGSSPTGPSTEPEATTIDPSEYTLTILHEANKKTYLVGSDFDPEGLSLAYMRNGMDVAIEVKDYTILDGDNLSLEQEFVTIVAENGMTVQHNIRVKETFRIACVGDSLTKGHSWPNQSYPTYLSSEVADGWEVGNFGENGISITGYGGSWNNPSMAYCKQHFYSDSLAYEPDIIAMMLGTNDATGWADAEASFESEYRALLDSYLEALPFVNVIMMVSPPTKDGNQFGIPNNVIKEQVNPIQRKLAQEYRFKTLDLREEFEANPNYESEYLRTEWNDGVHFSVVGAQYVAGRVWDIASTMDF